MANSRNIQAELNAALRLIEQLRDENKRLKQALSHEEPTEVPAATDAAVQLCLPTASAIEQTTPPSDKAEKVALFRSLFRGGKTSTPFGGR